MPKSALYLLSLFASALLVYPASGQTPKSINVFRLALEGPAGPRDQQYAKPIILRLREPVRIRGGFHARLLRGSVTDLKRYRPDSQGCVQFDTVVLPVRIGAAVQMQGLDDPAWLHPAGDRFESERYTVVFESGDEPTDSVIRIHQTELDNYFQHAISFTLIPPETLTRAVQKTVRQAEALLDGRRADFQRVTASVCWRVKSVVSANVDAGAETSVAAELAPCSQAPAELASDSQGQ